MIAMVIQDHQFVEMEILGHILILGMKMEQERMEQLMF